MNRDYLGEFIDYMKCSNYAPNTIESYKSCLSKFLNSFKVSPQNITTKQINRYRSMLKSSTLSKQTTGALKILYTQIVHQPLKVDKIKYPRRKKSIPQVYSSTQVQKLLLVTDNIKHKAILTLIYSSGLRISECINMVPSDIMSDTMRVYVSESKGFKDRYTPLSSYCLSILRAYYKNYRPKYYLFEGSEGKKYSATSIRKILERSKDKAKIHFGTVHTLRHSFATHLVEDGVNLKYIKEWLGHTSYKTTDIYTKTAQVEYYSPLDKVS